MRIKNFVTGLSLLVVALGCAPQKTDPSRKAAGEISSRDPQVAQRAIDAIADTGAAGAAAVPQLTTALGSAG